MQQLVPLAQRFGDMTGPGGPAHHDGGDAGWWIVSILIILLLATIAGLLIWLGRRAVAAANVAASPEGERAAALQALDLRLAQGDIAPEDYRARRDLLATGQTPVVAAPAPAAPSVDPDAPTEVQGS